jgi:sec-independent protein translocase protein TatA
MSLGIWQILLIVVLVLLLFGACKLPNVMGDLAKGVKNFKKGLEEDDSEPSKPAKKTPTKKIKK